MNYFRMAILLAPPSTNVLWNAHPALVIFFTPPFCLQNHQLKLFIDTHQHDDARASSTRNIRHGGLKDRRAGFHFAIRLFLA
jgi:hypothetical protein